MSENRLSIKGVPRTGTEFHRLWSCSLGYACLAYNIDRLVFSGHTNSCVDQYDLTMKDLYHRLGGGSILWWIK